MLLVTLRQQCSEEGRGKREEVIEYKTTHKNQMEEAIGINNPKK